MEKNNTKLTFGEKVGYGLGDFASVLIWQTISYYLLFFYTDVYGIKAAAAGFMIFLLRSLDAFIDPVVGMTADRTETRWGKFRPYLLWFSTPLIVLVVLTFSTPNFGESGKLIYAYITYGLMMIMYSVVNIPYSAMLGVLTSNSEERTSLSSFKYTGAYTSGIIIAVALLPLVKLLGNGNSSNPQAWKIVMSCIAVVVLGSLLITFFSTRERVRPMKNQKTSVLRDLADIFTNKPWVILLFVTLTMILFVASRLSITVYYFKYYIGEQQMFGINTTFEWLNGWFNGIGMGASLFGVMVLPFMTKLLGGKKRTFLIYFIVAALLTGSYYFLSPQDIVLIMVLQFFASFTGGPLSALIWAMYADTADYGEWKNKRRATGLVFSAAIFGQKIGWAIGAWFIGLLLTQFGYTENTVQNPEVKNLIRSLMSIIPLIAAIFSIILTLFYKLDEKTMKKIEADLKEMRKAGGEDSSS